VVLAHRPPISIPRTTVAPALLEELLGEVGSLASVYHKPSETFIGKGRIGADAVRKAGEYVFAGFLDSLAIYHFSYSLTDQFSTQKALQTVVAGQQAENLLYVDYNVIFMEIPS
jgi:AP-1 complex subunit beta-1